MTHQQLKEKMIADLQDWIRTQHGTAGWEVKLENLISHAMDEAADAQLTRSAINVIHKGKIGKIFFNFNETQRKEIIANVKKLLEQTN